MTSTTDTSVFFLAHAGAELYGADRVFLESARALAATGAQVFVALPSSGPLVTLLEEAGAQVHIFQTPVLRKNLLTPAGLMKLTGSAMAGMVRGIRLLHQTRPDAIYVNTVTIPLWPALGKLLGIPVLVHVHEAERTASRGLRTALALPLLCARSIVCNSNYSAGALSEVLPRLTSRTTVVHNGLLGPETVTRARETIQPPMRVLYIGRLSERKGVHTAIAAVALARENGTDVVLDVVGAVFPGNEKYFASLHHQVQSAGMTDAVTFHGFQSRVWTWFASCDVVIVPSAGDEPFGDTAVEAVLAARPVIASLTPGLSEAAGEYRCSQLVESGNTAAFAAAICAVQEKWAFYSEAAADDATAAAAKHSPVLYGQRIHAELLALMPSPAKVAV